MKALTTIFVLWGLAWFSFADESMPSCAAECLGTYLPQSPCNATDSACICSDPTLMGQVQNCTQAACSTIEALAALNATKTFCGEPVRDITMITPIITGISGSFAIVAVVLRIYDSIARESLLHWSNFCVILALVCSLSIGALEFQISAYGFGKDIWTIPPDNVTRILMYTWLAEILYMATHGLTKAAMLLLYLKVFPSEGFRKICFVMIVICLAYIPAMGLATVFNCNPIHYNWIGWTGETEGHCFSFNTFAWAQSSINILLDLIIILLPIPQLWKLNMGRKKRIQLVLMFSVGLFITVVSIVRLSALVEFATTTNATYDNVPTAYWSVLEIFVSVICCCLPAIRSLMKRVLPGCFGSSGSKDNRPTPYLSPKSLRFKINGGIQKSVTNTVTFGPSTGDAGSQTSAIELVDERWNERS